MEQKTKEMLANIAQAAHDAVVMDAEGDENCNLTVEETVALSNVVLAVAKAENEEERIRSEFRKKTEREEKLEWAKVFVPAGFTLLGIGITAVATGIQMTKAVNYNAGVVSSILFKEESGIITSKAFPGFVKPMPLPKIF